MEINDELISKLETLAKLNLNDKEKGIIKKDLGNILEMIDKIQEVDTDEVEPLQYVSDEVNVLREDIAKASLSNKEVLLNAPSTDGPYISVPKVIDIK